MERLDCAGLARGENSSCGGEQGGDTEEEERGMGECVGLGRGSRGVACCRWGCESRGESLFSKAGLGAYTSSVEYDEPSVQHLDAARQAVCESLLWTILVVLPMTMNDV